MTVLSVAFIPSTMFLPALMLRPAPTLQLTFAGLPTMLLTARTTSVTIPFGFAERRIMGKLTVDEPRLEAPFRLSAPDCVAAVKNPSDTQRWIRTTK
jgi:hypothetical protein